MFDKEETLLCYTFNKDFVYSGERILTWQDRSPSGNWLIPARCTTITPPEEQEGYNRVFNISDNDWNYEQIIDEENTEPEGPVIDPIVALKNNKILSFKNIADNMNKETIVYSEYVIPYDDEIKNKLVHAYIYLKENSTIVRDISWIINDNTYISLDINDIIQILNIVCSRTDQTNRVLEYLAEEVNSAMTEEEIESIEWPFDIIGYIREHIPDYGEENTELEIDRITELDSQLREYINNKDSSMKSYVDDKDSNMKIYVDEKDSTMKEYVDGKDSSMKTYVDNKDNSTRQYIDDKNSVMTDYVNNKDNTVREYIDEKDSYYYDTLKAYVDEIAAGIREEVLNLITTNIEENSGSEPEGETGNDDSGYDDNTQFWG